MCGIIGYNGEKNASYILLEGLKRLEYRGYDSAGIAVNGKNGLKIIKTEGKISKLQSLIMKEEPSGNIGIGHTRWATHGKPSDINAHPHRAGNVVLVHNGIVENFRELRLELEKKNVKFISETDTEVICHLINENFIKLKDPLFATIESLKCIKGSYAIVALFEGEEIIIGARKGAPLIIGIGEGENFFASDIPALLPFTNSFIFLEDEDVAVLGKNFYRIFNFEGKQVERKIHHLDWSPAMAEKGGYKHFMLKEIHEQPEALSNTIKPRIFHHFPYIHFEDIPLEELSSFEKIIFVACGTSWHACQLGRIYMEKYSLIPCSVELASEFRYRISPLDEKTLIIALSQSGETADTLESVREARRRGAKILSITNVLGSTITRESDYIVFTWAGPEIGVASTKTFITQIAVLLMLSLILGSIRGKIKDEELTSLIHHILEIPSFAREALKFGKEIEEIAKSFFKYSNFLYLGRGLSYPLAMEGALKLKEISYIHAEAYAAGEMKHGPLALVDENFPCVFILHPDVTSIKTLSNMEEVRARGGKIIAFTTWNAPEISSLSERVLCMPVSHPDISPFVLTIFLQLFAYHIAVLRGTDVDQPRNLAKSVTVE